MRSYEVLRDAADKIGVKALAKELRLSPALVYKWCEPPDDADDDTGARNPVDRVSEIVRLTGHTDVINWLCHEAGGFSARNPKPRGNDVEADLLEVTQHMVGAFSKLLSEVSKSAADNQISGGEAERIRDSWERLKSTAESFTTACEQGVYGNRA